MPDGSFTIDVGNDALEFRDLGLTDPVADGPSDHRGCWILVRPKSF